MYDEIKDGWHERRQGREMQLDMMVGSCWSGQVSFPCQLGVEYTIDELKAFARMKKPSLANKDFELIPTAQPVFKQ